MYRHQPPGPGPSISCRAARRQAERSRRAFTPTWEVVFEQTSSLLLFAAITLCHVSELSRSDAQVAKIDSWSRAWGRCGIAFFLTEAVGIDF